MDKSFGLLLQTGNRALQSAFGIYTNITYQYEEDDEDEPPECPAQGQERGKENA